MSKHLAILTGANLVTTVWRGREKLHYLNPAPINEIAERWINHYDQQRGTALSDLKKALEGTAMSKPEFVYTTYITPPRSGSGRADRPCLHQALLGDRVGIRLARRSYGDAGTRPG